MLYAGIDIGSSYTKAVLTDAGGGLVAKSCAKSGLSFEDVSVRLFEEVMAHAGCPRDDIGAVISTGVGRYNCPPSDRARSEISCLARAGFHLVGREHSVVDIGGQDNKIVHLGPKGRISSFKMNRKCAAGTGAFLEEIANRLDLDATSMNALATETSNSVEIGSYCTVFAGTEIIHHIRTGERREEIVRGVYESVVKRIFEMDAVGRTLLFSGGVVETHPVLIELLESMHGEPVIIPEYPQFTGAIGAAVYAIQFEK